MEAIQTLLYTIWEFTKMLAIMFWEILAIIPELIGLPEWTTVFILLAIFIVPIAIVLWRKYS